MEYYELTPEEQIGKLNEYAKKVGEFNEAQNALTYSDLNNCQLYEAQYKAIEEAKKTYNQIYRHLNKITEVLNTSKSDLESTNESLKKDIENTKIIDEIKKDMEDLIDDMTENDINKCNDLKNKLLSTIHEILDKYQELHESLTKSAKICIGKYKIAVNYYKNNGLNSTLDAEIIYYNEIATSFFTYLGIENYYD